MSAVGEFTHLYKPGHPPIRAGDLAQSRPSVARRIETLRLPDLYLSPDLQVQTHMGPMALSAIKAGDWLEVRIIDPAGHATAYPEPHQHYDNASVFYTYNFMLYSGVPLVIDGLDAWRPSLRRNWWLLVHRDIAAIDKAFYRPCMVGWLFRVLAVEDVRTNVVDIEGSWDTFGIQLRAS